MTRTAIQHDAYPRPAPPAWFVAKQAASSKGRAPLPQPPEASPSYAQHVGDVMITAAVGGTVAGIVGGTLSMAVGPVVQQLLGPAPPARRTQAHSNIAINPDGEGCVRPPKWPPPPHTRLTDIGTMGIGPGPLRPPENPWDAVEAAGPPIPDDSKYAVADAAADGIAMATGTGIGVMLVPILVPLVGPAAPFLGPIIGSGLGAGIVALGRVLRGR